MNFSFKIFSAVTLVVFSTSCEKEVLTYKPITPKLQVVGSILSFDSVAKCTITRTNDLNDITLNYINNANVVVFSGRNVLIDTLTNQGNGIYRGHKKLSLSGEQYRMESSAPEFPTATCDFQFPEKPVFVIDTFIYRRFNFTNLNPDPQTLSKCIITISDNESEDYYAIQCYRIDSVLNQSTNNYDYVYANRQATSSNFVVKSECVNNRVQNEGLVYFQDHTFNGKGFALDFDCRSISDKDFLIAVVVQSISKEYYNFLSSFCQQENAQGYSGEGINYVYNLYPYVPVYSNISSGTGIWGCYNYSIKKIIVHP